MEESLNLRPQSKQMVAVEVLLRVVQVGVPIDTVVKMVVPLPNFFQ
jgi:hypothetical protein